MKCDVSSKKISISVIKFPGKKLSILKIKSAGAGRDSALHVPSAAGATTSLFPLIVLKNYSSAEITESGTAISIPRIPVRRNL